jgi:hypothetical protein
MSTDQVMWVTAGASTPPVAARCQRFLGEAGADPDPAQQLRKGIGHFGAPPVPWLPSEANQQEDPERDAPFSPWPRPGPGSHQPGVEPPGRGRRALGEVELVASGQVHQAPWLPPPVRPNVLY